MKGKSTKSLSQDIQSRLKLATTNQIGRISCKEWRINVHGRSIVLSEEGWELRGFVGSSADLARAVSIGLLPRLLRDRLQERREEVKESISKLKDDVKQRAVDFKQNVRERLEERAVNLKQNVSGRFEHRGNDIKGVQDEGKDPGSAWRDRAQAAKETVSEKLEEHRQKRVERRAQVRANIGGLFSRIRGGTEEQPKQQLQHESPQQSSPSTCVLAPGKAESAAESSGP